MKKKIMVMVDIDNACSPEEVEEVMRVIITAITDVAEDPKVTKKLVAISADKLKKL